MKITTQLALPIIEKLITLTEHNINIMDETGKIVASGDPNRMNQIHSGAVRVLQTKEAFIIDYGEADDLAGTKPGVNLPIDFHGEIVGVVGVTGNPREIYKIAKMVKLTVEVLLQQMDLNNQLQHQKKMMESWVVDLLNPFMFDEKKLARIGQDFLHLNLDAAMSVFLIQFEESGENPGWLKQPEDRVIQSITSIISSSSIHMLLEEGFLFLLVPFSGKYKEEEIYLANKIAASCKQKYGYPLRIGIGKRYKGLSGYRRSYEQAKQSLNLMLKLKSGEIVAHIEEWGVVRLLDNLPSELREEFVEQYLPTTSNLSYDLLETLHAYFDCNLSIKETAERLHIHRNTLLYRLEKIEQELNINPKRFDDALLLKLLLLCKELNN